MTGDIRTDDAADSIVVVHDLEQPPEQVWRALTEPALLAAWLLPNDFRPEIGHRFVFDADPEEGGRIAGEVLEVESPRRLSYRWRGMDGRRDADDRPLDTIVTFELSALPAGGTRLRIVHGGFAAVQRPATTMLAGTARDLPRFMAPVALRRAA